MTITELAETALRACDADADDPREVLLRRLEWARWYLDMIRMEAEAANA